MTMTAAQKKAINAVKHCRVKGCGYATREIWKLSRHYSKAHPNMKRARKSRVIHDDSPWDKQMIYRILRKEGLI